MHIAVGETELLNDVPKIIEIEGEPYILTQKGDGCPAVFDAICPHQAGTVGVKNEECLRCPDHGWEFDPVSGESTTVPGESLTAYNTECRNGYIYVDIPDVDPTIEFTVEEHNGPKPTVSLLSHATLSIEYNSFRLLTDPWLDGPAFLGGWTQYPAPTCDIDNIAADTDAIWITHEHSDHLNRRTLSHFSQDTPIYVPELNYRRLSNRLSDIGFEHIHSLPTEETYSLSDGIEAVCFESASTWNDSILAVNCGGFRILNFNDAGLNWDVNRAIPSVDLVATSFAFGASGYPLTWEHVDAQEKRRIMNNRNEGALKHCEQVVDMFDPDYLLPFAKFFSFLQPEHEKYRRIIEQNRPKDVVNRLSSQDVEVLDLYPGEAWNGQNDEIDRREDREKLYTDEHEKTTVREQYKSHTPIIDRNFDLTHDELKAYFEALSDSTLSNEVGDHAFSLSLRGDNQDLHALIRFYDGDINYNKTDGPTQFDAVQTDTHVIMECDGRLVQHVIRHDLSWDEIHIGYWCKFKRRPDKYNLSFWRLLHAPWEARQDNPRTAEGYDIDTKLSGITMADLVEKENIEKTLSEYGLHCAGCPAGLGEDIIEAARIHGLDEKQTKALISRLEKSVL